MPASRKPPQGAAVGPPFGKGYDPRRHRLTRQEQSRGGRVSWTRFMIRWRLACNFPLPTWWRQYPDLVAIVQQHVAQTQESQQ